MFQTCFQSKVDFSKLITLEFTVSSENASVGRKSAKK